MSDAVKMCAFLIKKKMFPTCLVVIIGRLHVCSLKHHKHLKHNVKTNNKVISEDLLDIVYCVSKGPT